MTKEQDSLTRDAATRLSPFELQSQLIAIASKGAAIETAQLFNAGRGNPNWVATTAREAFFLLGHFALEEGRRTWNEPGLAGMPQSSGISQRLESFLNKSADVPCRCWLRNALAYCEKEFHFGPDQIVHEWVDGILGDNYPTAHRMLMRCERVVCRFLLQALGVRQDSHRQLDLFATEGATAGIGYLFDSLVVNKILRRGSRIALAVPTFSPYIEIPRLERYAFDVVEIRASEMRPDGSHTWQYPDEEIDKLLDPKIKALFLVNPSNPPSVAMSAHSLQRIVNIVMRSRPDLIVITDDVYATFVSDFRSLLAALPYNTVCLYSFSKYFGCTGWRLGVIALHQTNILDDKLADLPPNQRTALARRYAPLTPSPETLKFIDRLVADSRQVALNHTAGLSTPQQVQMALFALTDLLDQSGNYRRLTQGILRRRLTALWNGLGATMVDDPRRAGYYVELDLLAWARQHYGADFVRYLQQHHQPFDLLHALARESSIVLMPGEGFEGPTWSVRVSLANLPEEAYTLIGKSLHKIAESYVDEWRGTGG